jgi:hypothetical protein
VAGLAGDEQVEMRSHAGGVFSEGCRAWPWTQA